MARSLVIVESPAKAKTINRYLGNDYIVRSSVGHIRDLPVGGKASDPKARAKEAAKTRKLSPAKREAYKKEAARKQLVRRMGVDPNSNWDADLRDSARQGKGHRGAFEARGKCRSDLSGHRPRSGGRSHRLASEGNHRR